MKSIFISVLSLLIVLVTFTSCGSSKNKSANITEYLGESILVDYGRFVYERERCNTCHTQNISKANENLFSLDDYGGYRSPSWTLSFLIEPRFLLPGCTMPSFSYLQDSTLNKESLRKVLREKNITKKKTIDNYWKKLNTKTTDYLDNIQDYKVLKSHEKLDNSEIIPLVAYLQQIPRSPEKKYLDSIENIEYRKFVKKWDKLYEKSDSIISATLLEPGSTNKGKIIFNNNCTVCHGNNAQGMIGPNLTDEYWIYGGSNEDLINTILEGTINGMPSHRYKLKPKEIGQLLSFIKSLKGLNMEGQKDPQGVKED